MASASFLEPYHSYSIFGYSPWGLHCILTDAGLAPLWLRPGIDGATLTLRSAFGRRRLFSRWFSRPSPLNRFHDFRGRRHKVSVQRLNAWKLETAGQIVFAARRPAEAGIALAA